MRNFMKIVGESVNIIDNKNGVGNVPNNQNVDYLGKRVLMLPSVFLNLTPGVDRPMKTYDFVQKHLRDGGKIASPFLIVEIPEEWEDGNLAIPARIRGHEGRHRMMAVQSVLGDEPIEVHLFFAGGLRSRHIKPEWFEAIHARMVREKSKDIVKGPLFRVV